MHYEVRKNYTTANLLEGLDSFELELVVAGSTPDISDGEIKGARSLQHLIEWKWPMQ